MIRGLGDPHGKPERKSAENQAQCRQRPALCWPAEAHAPQLKE